MKIKNIIFLIIIVGLILFSLESFKIYPKILELQKYINHNLAVEAVIFTLLFSGLVIVAIPSSIIIIAAGALFGSIKGIIVSSISLLIGAILSFIISRYIAKSFVRKLVIKSPKLKKLNFITHKKGNIIIPIVRLLPIPSFIVNYGLGITKVSFRQYILWSWICEIPPILILTIGTNAIISFIVSRKIHWHILILGIILIILFSIFIKKILKNKKINII